MSEVLVQFDPQRNDYLEDGRTFTQLAEQLPADSGQWFDAAKRMNIVILALRWKLLHSGAVAEEKEMEEATAEFKRGYAEGWQNGVSYRRGSASGSDFYRMRDKYE